MTTTQPSQDDQKQAVLDGIAALLETGVRPRYRRKFGELPPVAMVTTPDSILAPLMEQAIVDGKPLTAEDLAKAQGLAPTPSGTDVLI